MQHWKAHCSIDVHYAALFSHCRRQVCVQWCMSGSAQSSLKLANVRAHHDLLKTLASVYDRLSLALGIYPYIYVFLGTPHSLLIELIIRITNALRRSKQPDMPA
jgi:hypothetical protein